MVVMEDVVRRIAKEEKTPELSNYWQSRYENILFKNNTLILLPKTLEWMNSNTVDRPVTPIAELDVKQFLSESKLDTQRLSDAVFMSIRFLDSVLEYIPFTAEARSRVDQYRKIGLGIYNIDEVVTELGGDDTLETIDYLGDVFSNYCYRASESLAEEKGMCENWGEVAYLDRIKSFDRWLGVEGNIISGLERTSYIKQNNIVASTLKMVQRRNSHILALPPNDTWKKWSDRDKVSDPIKQFIEQKQVIEKESETILKQDYETGEIVKIQKQGNHHFNKIALVKSFTPTSEGGYYTLESSDASISTERYLSKELASVTADQILSIIHSHSDIQLHLIARNIVGGKILLTEDGQLPSVSVEHKHSIKQTLANVVSMHLGQFVDISNLEYIHDEFDRINDTIHLVYSAEINYTNKKGNWHDINNIQDNHPQKNYLAKYTEQKSRTSEYKNELTQIKNKYEEIVLLNKVYEAEQKDWQWLGEFSTVTATKEITLTNNEIIILGIEKQSDKKRSIKLYSKTELSSTHTLCVLISYIINNYAAPKDGDIVAHVRGLLHDSISQEIMDYVQKYLE
jgi:Ribonucleotide reductase, barrel domain